MFHTNVRHEGGRARHRGWAHWNRSGVVVRCATGCPRSSRVPRAPRAYSTGRSRANLLSLERDSQVRGARGARIERINPLAHGPTTPRRFQCAHPRGRARTPSCRTFVWKKAEVCEAVKPSLKLKFFTLKFFGKSAVFRTLHARTVQ